MKIRNGYVSNSSSSSFVFLGNKIGLDQVLMLLIRQHKIYAVIESNKIDNSEEYDDVFEINFEFLKALEVMEINNIQIFDVFEIYEHGSLSEIFQGEGTLFMFDKDYYSTKTIGGLIDKYGE